MNVVVSLMKLLSSDKKNKKPARGSEKPPAFWNKAEVPKSGSKKTSRRTRNENDPLLASEDDRQRFRVGSEEARSGRGSDDSGDTPDRDRTDEDRVSQVTESLRTALVVSPKENTDENIWMDEFKDKTPARTAREKEWCEWLALREKESGARFQKALQDAVIQFGAQLEGAERNMDGALADLRAQMLSMQWNMAAGISQRDERISKLETQNCLLTGNRLRNADWEPPHHLSYDYSFAPVPPPFFLLRPSGPQYPMPDGSFPSYLQPPLDLDRRTPPFV